jgi:hypothetical protein
MDRRLMRTIMRLVVIASAIAIFLHMQLMFT